MIKLDLQKFSGRGGGSGMGRASALSAGGGGSATDRYNAAEADRARLAAISPSQRTPEQHQQLADAMQRKTDAAYGMISEMSDAQIQAAADRYIKYEVEHPTETNAAMRQWIRRISGTKRDGSPTKSALDNAESETWNVINNTSGMGLGTRAYSYMDHPTETNRIANALVRAASKYRNRFD